jgi:hypothetical protein
MALSGSLPVAHHLQQVLFGIISVPDLLHTKPMQAVEIEISSLVADLDEGVEF